jgi:hypothetical protein
MMNLERLSPEEELKSYGLWERAAQELRRVLPVGLQNKADDVPLVRSNTSAN